MPNIRGRILCVDDEPNILRSLQWLLQREFEVKTATSGHDGLALVRENDFDVVISDQRMPGMMGSEFLREVRKLSPRSMRILLTGYSDLQAVLRSVNESEVFRFINKPWKINELPAVVAEAAHIARTQPVPSASEDGHFDSNVETILVVDDEADMSDLLSQEIGGAAKVLHARNLAEAIAAFDSDQDIGIVLSDTRVDNMDTTRMLKMLKHDNADIVTVVCTGETDATDVITLINQGQIFRIIPKPVKPSLLMMAIKAASLKRKQLKDNPEFANRHKVDDLGEESRQAFIEDVRRVSQTLEPGGGDTGGSILGRLSGGLKKLFGRG
jgi:DNA-binding NtrC family response regulator